MLPGMAAVWNNFVPALTLYAACTLACARAGPLRILPLGDSITHGYGEGIATFNSYRKTLKALLAADGFDTDFVGSLSDGDFADPQHEGRDGWYADHDSSTNTLRGHVAEWMEETQADIVLLHIGTNDIIDGNANADEVSLILDEILAANSNATVVLAQIINSWPNRPDITVYNSNLSAMASARIAHGDDLLLVDMEHGAGIAYAAPDMADSYHPSQLGYDKMGTNWHAATIAAIHRQLEKRRPRITSVSIGTDTLWLGLSNLRTGHTVSVERAETLSTYGWIALETFVPAEAGTNWPSPLNPGAGQAFYRLSTD